MVFSSMKVTSGDGSLQPEALKCPRCESSNTKFCYYNNYSKIQPRYFCKACKRHWTEGGSLRNVPMGGGRKNRHLKARVPNTAAAPSATSTVNVINNEAIPRRQSSEFHLQEFGFSYGNKLLDGDHLYKGPISSSLEANLCSLQSFAMEDSSATAMIPSTSSSVTWQVDGNNGGMEYWNWDDIDSFVSTDLNISLLDDPAEIKP